MHQYAPHMHNHLFEIPVLTCRLPYLLPNKYGRQAKSWNRGI